MEQDFTNVKSQLQRLDSPQIKQAEKQLLRKCQSKKGLYCLSSFLIDSQLSLKQRRLTASMINLILTKDKNLIVFEQFAEEYLLEIIADWAIPFQIKLMMMRSIQLQMVKAPNFLKDVYKLAKAILAETEAVSDELLLIVKEQLQGVGQIGTTEMGNLQKELIEGCQVIIGIAYWIVSFIIVLDKEDRGQNQQIVQHIPLITTVCTQLHELMVGIPPSNSVWKHLLDVYSMITYQNGSPELIDICWSYISVCTYLPKILKDIYLMNATAQTKTVASKVHLEIIKYFHCKKNEQKMDTFFDEETIQFLKKQCIEKGSQPINQINQFNKSLYHILAILQYYYQRNVSKISLTDRIQVAQTLVFPIIDNCFNWYKQQSFHKNPAQLYRILQTIMNFNNDYSHVLAPLAYIIGNFVHLQMNFFLFLFQRIRQSLQKTLKCQNSDDWQPPEYLQSRAPLQIDILLFLLPYIQNPSQPQLLSGIYFYLQTVITPPFLHRLQSFELAMFYFFLQNSWLQIYKDNFKKSQFLLNYLFKSSIHSSSKYFIYQCIYKLSNSVIDIQYLMGYVHHLPQLKVSNNKWKIILKWISLVLAQDLEEGYLLKLITQMREYLNGVIYTMSKQKCLPYKQVQSYIDVLTIIARHSTPSRTMVRLQKMLLTEFTNMQALINQQIEDSYYCLITELTPLIACLQNYELLFIKYLYPMLYSKKKSKSNKFHLLLAQYIYYLTSKQAIEYIYEFIYSTISIEQILKAKNGQEMKKILFKICDYLVLLQNMQLKHWDQLQKKERQSMMGLISKMKKVFIIGSQKIDIFQCNQIKNTIQQRTCILELTYLKNIKQYEAIDYQQLWLKVKRCIFREYQAKLLIYVLDQFNPHVTKQDNRSIQQIIMSIFMRNKQIELNLQRNIQNRIYFITRKMSASKLLQPTIKGQVQKLMTFYSIPLEHVQASWIKQRILGISVEQKVIVCTEKDFPEYQGSKCIRRTIQQQGQVQEENQFYKIKIINQPFEPQAENSQNTQSLGQQETQNKNEDKQQGIYNQNTLKKDQKEDNSQQPKKEDCPLSKKWQEEPFKGQKLEKTSKQEPKTDQPKTEQNQQKQQDF